MNRGRRPIFIATVTLALAACGGIGERSDPTSVVSAESTASTNESSDQEDVGETTSGEPGVGASEVPTIAALLPAPGAASLGNTTSPGSCEAPDETIGLAARSYSVPNTWVRSSRSCRGGGGALDDFVEFQYTTETGPVTITFEQDARDSVGNVMVGDERRNRSTIASRAATGQ